MRKIPEKFLWVVYICEKIALKIYRNIIFTQKSTYDFKVFSTKLLFPVVWLDFPLLAHSLAALKFKSGFTFAFTSILKVTVVLQLYWNWSIFSQIRANKVPLYSLNGHMYHVQPVHSHGFSILPISSLM